MGHRIFSHLNGVGAISDEASNTVAKALNIINSAPISVFGINAAQNAELKEYFIEAATLLQKAHMLHPKDPVLHFAYASCLLLAELPEALVEMEKVVASHSNFELAQIAIRGWGKWQPIFFLPQLTLEGKVPPPISNTLTFRLQEYGQNMGLFALRGGLLPVSAVFYRATI